MSAEKLYTLREAAVVLARQACAREGHLFNVQHATRVDGERVRVMCERP